MRVPGDDMPAAALEGPRRPADPGNSRHSITRSRARSAIDVGTFGADRRFDADAGRHGIARPAPVDARSRMEP